ncbi:MAG TPA: TetR/AcrR family transcriptional regulator [Acidimicrobiales bacterium]|nr:TetR/AcrR family transcriptional regulator [Acidimicrobiales bacterium]
MTAASSADAPPPAKRARMRPEDRRAEIVAGAREVFASRGYVDTGLAEVAVAANVSKGLLYHYFPGGRAELVVCVAEELLEELLRELRHAARVPFSPQARLTHLLSAIFTFFDENPDTYRLLFGDPAFSHDPAFASTATSIRAQIASELAKLLAGSSLPPDDVVAASVGILGFALANVELCLAGRLEPEHAWKVTCLFCAAPIGSPESTRPDEG